MKKILFTLMLLLCATAGMAEETPLTKNADGYYLVSTAEELQRAVQSELSEDSTTSSSKIRLTADIYLSELPVGTTTLSNTFSGKIDGTYTYTDSTGVEKKNGYTIYGGHRDELNSKRLRKCNYLFTFLRGASFENVRFKHIRVEDEDNDNQGIIAAQAWDTNFKFVGVDSCSVFCDENYAGMMVGQAWNCVFENVAIIVSDVRVGGQYGGCLVGHSKNCEYNICTTSRGTGVFVDGSDKDNHAYCGGLVGYSELDKFTSCINMAIVGASQCQVGGIAGQSVLSNFYNCSNAAPVAHMMEGEFDNVLKDERQKLETLGNIYIAKAGASVWAGAGAGMLIALPTYAWLSIMGAGAALMSAACIVVLVVWIVGTIAFYIYLGDDEVGGICGLADGGEFQMCSNFGPTRCRDDNGGGIVGLGYGVTINNCYNGGAVDYDEDSKGGAIIGNAKKDSRGNSSKVTNCCANVAYHLVGNTDGLDPDSGNNYRLSDNGKTEASYCEMSVDSLKMKSGIVALWLNQSTENREIRPWRQKLTCDPTNPNDTIIDIAPCLDPGHPIITLEDLDYLEISDAAGLKAYADSINSGRQFKCAVLTSDIDMTGQKWTPIGKDAPNCHFRGIFDGRGHTVRGLECSSDKAVGLFGALHANAEIRNVFVQDANFSCSTVAGAGGIVGEVKMGWSWGYVYIDKCGAYGDVNISGERHAGGVLGNVDTPDNNYRIKVYVRDCFSLANITAGYGNSALLCGYTKNNGVIRNCWSAGQLRNGKDKTIWPYSWDNGTSERRAEYLVGYERQVDIVDGFVVVGTESRIDRFGEYPTQYSVEVIPDEMAKSGELTVMLNKGETDGTQMWYQTIGKDNYPVRTKLPDGTNIVFWYKENGNIRNSFGNTSREEISDVILGKESIEGRRVTDVNKDSVVNIADMMSFSAAAIK